MVSHFSLAPFGAHRDNRWQSLWGCVGPWVPSVLSTHVPVGRSCSAVPGRASYCSCCAWLRPEGTPPWGGGLGLRRYSQPLLSLQL